MSEKNNDNEFELDMSSLDNLLDDLDTNNIDLEDINGESNDISQGIRDVNTGNLNIDDAELQLNKDLESLGLDFSDMDIDNMEGLSDDGFSEDEDDKDLDLDGLNLDLDGLMLDEDNEDKYTASSTGGINVEQYIERLMIYALNTRIKSQDSKLKSVLDASAETEKLTSEFSKHYYLTRQILDSYMDEIAEIVRKDINRGVYSNNIEDYVDSEIRTEILQKVLSVEGNSNRKADKILYKASVNKQLSECLKSLQDKMAQEDKQFSNNMKIYKEIVETKKDFLDAVSDLKEQDDFELLTSLKYKRFVNIVEADEQYSKSIEGLWFTECPNCDEQVSCNDLFDLYITRPSSINATHVHNGVGELITRGYNLVPQDRLYQMLADIAVSNQALAGTILSKPIRCPHCGKYIIIPLPVIKGLEKGLLNKYTQHTNKNVETILLIKPNPHLIMDISEEIPESDFHFTILDEEENIVSESDTKAENIFASLPKYLKEYKDTERAIFHVEQLRTKDDFRKTIVYSILSSGTQNLTKRLQTISRGVSVELYNSVIFKTTEYYYKHMVDSLALLLDYDKWLKFYEALTGGDRTVVMNGDYSLYDFNNFTIELLYTKRGDRSFKDFNCVISDDNFDIELVEKVKPYVDKCRQDAFKLYEHNRQNYNFNRNYILQHPDMLNFRNFKEHSDDKTENVLKVLGTDIRVVNYLKSLAENVCETYSTRELQTYKRFENINVLLRALPFENQEVLYIDDRYVSNVYRQAYALARFVEHYRSAPPMSCIKIYNHIYTAVINSIEEFKYMDCLLTATEFIAKWDDVSSDNEKKLLVYEVFLSKFFTNRGNLEKLCNILRHELKSYTDLDKDEKLLVKYLSNNYSKVTLDMLVTINKIFYRDIQVFLSALETVHSCYQTFVLNNYVQFNKQYIEILDLVDDIQFCTMCCVFGLGKQLQDLGSYKPDTSVSLTTEVTKLLQSVSFTPSEIEEFMNRTDISTLSVTQYVKKAYKSIDSFFASGIVGSHQTSTLVVKPFSGFFLENSKLRVMLRMFVLLRNNINSANLNIKQTYLKNVNVVNTFRNIYIFYTVLKYTDTDSVQVIEKLLGNTIMHLIDNFVTDSDTIFDFFNQARLELDTSLSTEQPLYPCIIDDVFDYTIRVYKIEDIDVEISYEEKYNILQTELGTDVLEDIQTSVPIMDKGESIDE